VVKDETFKKEGARERRASVVTSCGKKKGKSVCKRAEYMKRSEYISSEKYS
jgi:hypothetical protein